MTLNAIVPMHKPLASAPDEEDWRLWRINLDPALLTDRLGELVPLLRFVGFRVEEVTESRTILTAPLLESAMNQNGTHQAAVFYLLADYTLGIAMGAALPGTYTVGVHDRCHALPIQFWLKRGHVEHLAPGNGTIRAEACLDDATRQQLREGLRTKGRAELSGAVRIYQNDVLVATAEHEMGVYADLPRVWGERASVSQVSRVKTSALMIAALRGDTLSSRLAQAQGIAVAQRMARASPQLPHLVQARTKHLNDHLNLHATRYSQIIVLGVGLDPKPVQFGNAGPRWILCDLREMLKERRARLREAGASDGSSVEVALDLRLPDWPAKLIAAGLDPALPTLCVLEGVSMYLTEPELQTSLAGIRELLAHPASRLWLDHVTADLLTMEDPTVKAFLRNMARLGEPFTSGFDRLDELAGQDWRIESVTSAWDVLHANEPVGREYRFVLMATDARRPRR